MRTVADPVKFSTIAARTSTHGIQRELLRKSIHMLIALVPFGAAIVGVEIMLYLLGIGVVVYTYAETQRLRGNSIPIVSRITSMASREREFGHFVLGPVSLGIGAMLALLLYPYPAAVVAIYALAFGDGFSSIVGKMFGKIQIPGTGGKTIAGSMACFIAILIVSFAATHSLNSAVLIAAAGTFLEALPTKDFDNILLPMGVGFITQLLMIV